MRVLLSEVHRLPADAADRLGRIDFLFIAPECLLVVPIPVGSVSVCQRNHLPGGMQKEARGYP